MYRAEGYYSSDDSDDDDLEYFASKHVHPAKLSEANVEENKLEIVRTKLFNCVQHGDVEESVELIKDNNLSVDLQIHQDWTPLMLAASYGHFELTRALIKLGADVHQTKDMETVLMYACKISTVNSNFDKVFDIVKLLMELKVDANIINAKRMTAFLFAASNGNIDVVQYLKKFCDTNATDNQGWNALFHAVDGNHYILVKYLLQMGMDPKKRDVRQNTPLVYARHNNFRKIEELMPDDIVLERQYESYLGDTYSFRDELANPKFMRDVYVMLYGMNSASLVPKFQEDPTMSLTKFLTMTKPDLEALGITKPYQMNRLLGGLYEFHVHPYKFKSLGHCSEKSIISTYDVGFRMFSIIRHYVTMQATLKYLRLNVTQWDDKCLEDMVKMEKTLAGAQKLVKRLRKRVTSWEKENKPVDLITYPNKPKTNKIYYFLPLVTAISIVFYFRYHL